MVKDLLFASVIAATAAGFGLALGGSPNVARAQDIVKPSKAVSDGASEQVVEAADECITVWVDGHPGPGKRCYAIECCHSGCMNLTCEDDI